jgi:hypothetical protein
MTSANFCGACGRALATDDRFCPGCGKQLGATPPDLTAPPDLIKQPPPVTPVRPPPTSTVPFDPYKPIGPDNPVPPDSIWATAPYPGEVPAAASRGSLPSRIRAPGTLRGRPAAEIINVLGPPRTISSMAGGGKLRQWIKHSAYTGSYHYALRFDPYDICIGITHQTG